MRSGNKKAGGPGRLGKARCKTATTNMISKGEQGRREKDFIKVDQRLSEDQST